MTTAWRPSTPKVQRPHTRLLLTVSCILIPPLTATRLFKKCTAACAWYKSAAKATSAPLPKSLKTKYFPLPCAGFPSNISLSRAGRVSQLHPINFLSTPNQISLPCRERSTTVSSGEGSCASFTP